MYELMKYIFFGEEITQSTLNIIYMKQIIKLLY